MMVDFDISIIAVLIVIYILLLLFFKVKKHRCNAYLIFFTLFYVYLCCVIKYTQFPIMIITESDYNYSIWSNINYIPLLHLTSYDIETSVLNIIMTIPFGILYPMLKNRTFLNMVISGVLLGLIIEFLQLTVLLTFKFSLRVVDINDVIFNFIGVLIGFVVYKLFIIFLNKLITHFPDLHNFLSVFLLRDMSAKISHKKS